MKDNQVNVSDHGHAVVEPVRCCQPAPKWLTQVNDENVHAPRQRVKARVLKDQAGVPADDVLVRDHGSKHDVAFDDDDEVDLSEGNVFYTVAPCDRPPQGGCPGPAKLAWFIDDQPETTLRSEQTGRTLRELFGLTAAVRLFRDFESPNDEAIGLDTALRFVDGPVFYTRRAGYGLTVTVNKQTFGTADGVKAKMTAEEIGKLITDQPCEVKRISDDREVIIGLNETVEIKGCEDFMVIRCNVVGGFEPARIERDLAMLRQNGCRVDFINSPVAAVIYRAVPTRCGYPHLTETDILVTIPSAFPGVMLDGAYLPKGSPLIGKVAGAGGQSELKADGRKWELISYHPHNGGGGEQWNPSRHGIHTYFSEVLAWIQAAQN